MIFEFIHKHDLCVLSTVNQQGSPESAVLGFSDNKDFEIVVATSLNNRKFRNLENNPKVSIVIGWDENITVQYEGTASVLDGKTLVQYQVQHFSKLPSAEKYNDNPDERYILVRPKWLRYTDCNEDPWQIQELSFD